MREIVFPAIALLISLLALGLALYPSLQRYFTEPKIALVLPQNDPARKCP